MKNIYKLVTKFLEWAKIIFKEDQYYYSNKIQENLKNKTHRNIGAGKIYLFSNRTKNLFKLAEDKGFDNIRFYEIKGKVCIMLMGSEITHARTLSKHSSLPTNEIISILRKQKTD